MGNEVMFLSLTEVFMFLDPFDLHMCLLHASVNYLFVFVCEVSDCGILTAEIYEKQLEWAKFSGPLHHGPRSGP